LPTANTVENVYGCDDDSVGIANFDLTGVESTLLGGQTGMIVEYYDQNGNPLPNPLPNPFVNSVANQETITARVINSQTGCYDETTFNLIVNSVPIANPLEALIGCDDNSDGISEYFDTSLVESIVLGGQTGMEVTYYDNNGLQLSNPLPNPFTNTQIYNQDLIVRVTNSQTGCFYETILVLETSSKPSINQPQNLYACDEGNGYAGFDTSIIESELTGNQTGLRISYTDAQGNVLPSPLPTTFQNTSAYNQTIFVKVENELSSLCYSETSFELIINELPPIDIEPNYFICNLDPSIALSIDMNYNTYQWQFEDGNIISTIHQANILDEGNYVLTVSRIENGVTCENSFAFHLTRSILPNIQEVKYDELGNNFIEIIASGDGDFEFSIDGINYQDSNYFGNIPGGVYIVYVRDKEGCGEDFTEVAIVDYPKFFTPNNDGYNDYWQIKGLNAQLRTSSDIFIFDRYGKLLKQLASTSEGWDGTFNGQDLPSNDYWFTVDLNDGRAFQGHFTLKR
jgi:gliding motility-associated-like protein